MAGPDVQLAKSSGIVRNKPLGKPKLQLLALKLASEQRLSTGWLDEWIDGWIKICYCHLEQFLVLLFGASVCPMDNLNKRNRSHSIFKSN